MFSEDAYTTPLFSEQDELDQRTGMIGTATAADNKEVLVIFAQHEKCSKPFCWR